MCRGVHLVRDEGDDPEPRGIDRIDQMADQRRLARADIAGDDDEALALRQAIAEIGHRLAVRGGLEPEARIGRSEEHTSELQSLMRISYAVFCLKKNTNNNKRNTYDI